MSTIETGGPAFPMQEPQAIHAYAMAAVDGITNPDERDRAYIKAQAEAVGGATLRDYFAAKAMQAWLSGHVAHYGHENFWALDAIAQSSYEMADAMIKARKEKS